MAILYYLNVSILLLKSERVQFDADDIFKYVSYVSKETGFDISCKLPPMHYFLE